MHFSEKEDILTPLQLIKSGILSGDLDVVARGYNHMTGENIEPPDYEEEIFDEETGEWVVDTKPVISQENPKIVQTLDRPRDNMDFRVNKSDEYRGLNRRVPVKASSEPNKFNPNIDVVPEDTNYEKINDNVKPVPRTRPPANDVSVACVDCKEQLIVSSSLVRDGRYTCDKCIEEKVKRRN